MKRKIWTNLHLKISKEHPYILLSKSEKKRLMPTFNYTVDTEPMASQLKRVSNHVNATTGAVVAMQTAVILAEQKAADHVCNNVNKGFYSLIRSQISQKMAKLQSDVDSHFMQLVQQKNALISIKTRMERDYNMIAKRYIKLFNALNANLKSRVFELDKPTIDFSVREVEKLNNRVRYLTATVPLVQVESLSLGQKLIATNVKKRGAEVVEAMKGFLLDMKHQKEVTGQILIQDSRFNKSCPIYIPVVIRQTTSDESNRFNIDVYMPKTGLNQTQQSSIRNKIYDVVKDIQWKENAAEKSAVDEEFYKLVSKSVASDRIKEVVKRLFESNTYETI